MPTDNDKVVEGNRLICEFMGLVAYNEKGHPHQYGYYDMDWNNLMPVVEKIAIMGMEAELPDARDLGNEAAKVATIQVCCNIKTVWIAAVDFIKWYNSQSSKIKEEQ